MDTMNGKVALVTGGEQGLGVARTVRFALSQPRASAIAELTMVPLTESSWP